MRVFLSFRNPQLFLSRFTDDFSKNVVQSLRQECDGTIKRVVIVGQRDVVNLRLHLAIESIEVVEQERARKLSCTVRAKINGLRNSSVSPSAYRFRMASPGSLSTDSPSPKTMASHASLVRSQRLSRSMAK